MYMETNKFGRQTSVEDMHTASGHLSVEHRRDHIHQHFAALVRGNVLGLESLVQDVQHLPP